MSIHNQSDPADGARPPPPLACGADPSAGAGAARTDAGADLGGAPPAEPQVMGGGVDIFSTDNHLRPLANIEADIIRLAIGHYRGRMSEVARRLGIGRSTLYRKLSELGIESRN